MTKTPKVVIPPKPFIATVSIASNNHILQIPFYGNADIEVDWGDGNKEKFIGYIWLPNHTYTSMGQYTITILGTVEGMNSFGLSSSWSYDLISIDQWGDLGLVYLQNACISCFNLVSIPNTPLGYPNITNVDGIFAYCYDLIEIPANLFKYNTLVTNFRDAFSGCNSLTSIPPGLFDNNKEVTTFQGTFSNCSSLTSIPAGLFANNKEVTTFNDTFRNCSSLTGINAIPADLFNNNKLVTTFYNTFNNCSSLIIIPEHLFDQNTAVTTFSFTFQNCTSLTSIPTGLFFNNKLVEYFNNTFDGCTSLTGTTPNDIRDSYTIELWERTTPLYVSLYGYPSSISGTACFQGCTGLSNYGSAVSAGWT